MLNWQYILWPMGFKNCNTYVFPTCCDASCYITSGEKLIHNQELQIRIWQETSDDHYLYSRHHLRTNWTTSEAAICTTVHISTHFETSENITLSTTLRVTGTGTGALNTRSGRVVSFMPTRFTTRDSLQYPLNRRLGWVGCRAGLTALEKRKFSCPCQEPNDVSSQVQLLA